MTLNEVLLETGFPTLLGKAVVFLLYSLWSWAVLSLFQTVERHFNFQSPPLIFISLYILSSIPFVIFVEATFVRARLESTVPIGQCLEDHLTEPSWVLLYKGFTHERY